MRPIFSQKYLLFFFVIPLYLYVGARAEVTRDGLCKILSFVPFTYQGNEIPFRNNLGFSHMAAALLAFQHFNDRDPSVVAELADPKFSIEQCNVQLDMNSSVFFDTEILSTISPKLVMDHVLRHGPPCAIAGPYFDEPAYDLATMATSLDIPIVAHRVLDMKFVVDFLYPYMTPANGFGLGFTAPLARYLQQQRGRTNHIALLHSVKPQYELLTRAVTNVFRDLRVNTAVFSYFSGQVDLNEQQNQPLHIKHVLPRVKELGFRTIVVLSGEFDLQYDLLEIADEAERLGMNQGEHFWVFCTGLPPGLVEWGKKHDKVVKLLQGAATLDFADGFSIDKEDDPFLRSWRQQNTTMLEIVKAHNPIPVDAPGHFEPGDNYFQTVTPEHGAGFLYDSIMAIGMGACLQKPTQQKQQQQLGNTTGLDHVKGIRSVNFTGATGRMAFERGVVNGTFGMRNYTAGMYAAYNLLPPGGKGDYVLTDVLDLARTSVTLVRNNDDGHPLDWISVEEFIFADGRTVGPDLLRDIPDQNYLSQTARAVGLSLLAIAAFLAVLTMSWIFGYRNRPVLKAAQPILLLLLCMGALLQSFTILSFSFDESYGLTEEQLSSLCVTGPWLFMLGHIASYSALFAKLWRVHKVLQFTRVRVTLAQAVWPIRLMFLATVVLLTIWTIFSGFGWMRVVVDEVTEESFGRCGSPDENPWFFFSQVVLGAAPVVFAFTMAWKTKDVDDSFSESWWIFALIFVQLQAAIVSVPLFVILRDLSTVGRYIGLVLMVFVFAVSTLVLIMLPKVLTFYGVYGGKNGDRDSRRGGASGNIRVSGLHEQAATRLNSHIRCESFPDSSGADQIVKTDQDDT